MLYESLEKNEKAIECFIKSLNIREHLTSQKDSNYHDILKTLVGLFEKMNNSEKAEEFRLRMNDSKAFVPEL